MSKSKQVKKKLVPKLRFPEFKGDGEWEKHTINEYLIESRIKGSKGNLAKKITVKLWGKGVFEKNDKIKGSINTQYYRRSTGQFIYSKLDFLNQAFGLIPKYLNNYESTVDLPCFNINEDLNPIFLLEYVKRKMFYKNLGETADGSRKAKRIHADTFLAFPIINPKIKEQQKIAACLSSVDALITAHTQKHEALQAYKKGLMQQLFPTPNQTTPKLRFPEFKNEGEWESNKLSYCILLISGIHLSPNEYASEGQTPYFTGPSDFTNCQSSITKWTNTSANDAKTNDILITVKGSGVGELWYLKLPTVALGRQLMAIRGTGCSSKFIFQFLSTQKIRFESLGSGNLIPGLSRGDILNMPLRIPSISEQKKIADTLSSIDNLIAAEAQKIESLKAHKKGLMQQLFPQQII